MDLGIQDKKALVTGSTAGIGFATAKRLAAEGATVVLNGRTRERIEEARKKILDRVAEARIEGVAADLSGAEGCERVIEAHPEVDILVNNMGIFEPVGFHDIPDEDWMRFFEANVMSGVRLSRHYLPGMKERDWGRIVFVSSESGVQIPDEMLHYGVTKTAQIGLARGLAELTKGTGVTVNSILPGPTKSEGVRGFVQERAEQEGVGFETMEERFFQHERPTSLLQRFATVEEVASMIAYAVSAAASATNGAPLRVDGGVIRSAF